MAKGSGKGKKEDEVQNGDDPKEDEKSSGKTKSRKDRKAEKVEMAKKAEKSKKGGKPKREATKRSRFSPVKTTVHESAMKEVSALRAFLLSFMFLALILAPVLGLGMYFVWDSVGALNSPEDAFLIGMGTGTALAFVISVLFTRKAVATA